MSIEKGMIEEVMAAIEQFYFSDGPESGEDIFKQFASKHHHIFEDDCDILTE